MSALRAMLKNGRSRQRGSVLSGVLIMTAFIAIISGALMTALSGNFLLSYNQMNKAANEATVNSALEAAVNEMQTTYINTGCPDLALAQVHLNGRYAVPTYMSCWPAYREKQYSALPLSTSFSSSGSHSVIPRANQDLYVIGDSAGNVYQFPFGQSSPNWSYSLPGTAVAPPVTLPDMGGNNSDLVTLVPLNIQDPNSRPPACQASNGCVALLIQDVGRAPDGICYMPAKGLVASRVAAGVNFPTLVYFGDQTGAMFAYLAVEGGNCAAKASNSVNNQPIVAGPFVFAGPISGSTTTDEIYVVTSSSVLRYTYSVKGTLAPVMSLVGTLALPSSNPVGVAIDGDNVNVPTKLAITFAGGELTVVQLQSGFGMQIVANAQIPSAINSGPFWCDCPGADQIAVAGDGGGLYLFDAALNPLGSFTGGVAAVTGPTTDSVGDWFIGASDGYVHELQLPAGQSTMVDVAKFGSLGSSASGPVLVSACSAGLCLYAGAQNGNQYLVPLDARDAVISVCISAALPTCSGANPRLWAMVEVGSIGNKQTVHVQGWSYYSP